MWTNYNHYNPMPIRPSVNASFIQNPPISKRKWQFYFPDEEVKPSKIHVTEEMMANQLDGLHLSSNYTSHGIQPSQPPATPSTSGIQNLSANLPKLTMCDELRSLKDSFNILPKVLEPERPTQALILWQPPAGDLGKRKEMEGSGRNQRAHAQKLNGCSIMSNLPEVDLDGCSIRGREVNSSWKETNLDERRGSNTVQMETSSN